MPVSSGGRATWTHGPGGTRGEGAGSRCRCIPPRAATAPCPQHQCSGRPHGSMGPHCPGLATSAGGHGPNMHPLSSWYLNNHTPADDPGGDRRFVVRAGLQLAQLGRELLQAGRGHRPVTPLRRALPEPAVPLEVLLAQPRG